MKILILLIGFLAGCSTLPVEKQRSVSALLEEIGILYSLEPSTSKRPRVEIAGDISTAGSSLQPIKRFKVSEGIVASFFAPTTSQPTVTVPFRRFLLNGKGKNALLDPELKSFVVFTHRPGNEEEHKLYESVCRQWEADFETYESALETAKYLPYPKLTPVYWPTSGKDVRSGDCSTLYNYDYSFSQAVSSLIGTQAHSKGPLLVLQQNREWLVLDISKFDPVDVQRAFLIWKMQICSTNPLSAKFNLVKFREYFRTLVNTYGESIAKYVKVS